MAFTILNNLGMDSSVFQRQYEKVKNTVNMDVTGENNFTEDINNVIQNAFEQANIWGHTYIGTEHLLIVILLAEAGLGFNILSNLGVTKEKVCEETTKLIVCQNKCTAFFI